MPAADAKARIYYGCAFCRTMREAAVVRALEDQCSSLKATAISQVKHKSEHGRKSTIEHILMPGYVFFMTDQEISAASFDISDIIRLLRNTEGSWKLAGSDEEFARWIFKNEGTIGLSKAHVIGDQIKICDGPLKELQGNLIRIDRRNRNGQVELRFDDRVWRVWLAFEIIE